MPNRLARETSPYLRQHADNPVDWFPWGPEAFAKARTEQKPIFLSIGYSTCHWCHVMAHESFESPAVAAFLNEYYVAIKVDREERPDVDRVYMAYVQAVTGHGGWPLSAWLTPDLKPFYGGTYFPPEDRHQRPGFPSILAGIAQAWAEERPKLIEEGDRVLAALSRVRDEDGAGETPGSQLQAEGERAGAEAYRQLAASFDAARGGFGGAPKFPRASNLTFLLRHAVKVGLDQPEGREAVSFVARTLSAMARGGIHDHVGGGFHRYAVDEDWFVPHFEKMLYDQAQIALNALEAWQATGDERHAWLVRDIFEYALRDLAHPAGGFYSAEDADSAVAEGEHAVEGAFYVWTKAEIELALEPRDAALICAHYGVRDDGNVPAARDSFHEFTGKNILAQTRSLAETARAEGWPLQEASDRLAASLASLREVRATRPRPQRDDKILAAWNGLIISALARAAVAPAEALAEHREAYRRAAVGAAAFVERELFDGKRGVLIRSWRETRGAADGFAEDYAYFIQGLIDLYEATFDLRWLEWAERLQAKMDELFWDEAAGGYFNSAAGAADLLLRLKDDYDGAEPASSSVAALNLLRLAAVFDAPTGPGRRERAVRVLAAFRGRWQPYPQALPQMLCAFASAFAPPRQVVLAGDPSAADFRALAAVLAERLGPMRSVLAMDGTPGAQKLAASRPWLAEMRPKGGRATAYVCQDFTCQAPVTTPDELRRLL